MPVPRALGPGREGYPSAIFLPGPRLDPHQLPAIRMYPAELGLEMREAIHAVDMENMWWFMHQNRLLPGKHFRSESRRPSSSSTPTWGAPRAREAHKQTGPHADAMCIVAELHSNALNLEFLRKEPSGLGNEVAPRLATSAGFSSSSTFLPLGGN